ncbi:MAG: DNA-deoxyinosine glycosylase [Candidatus Cloacimonetes bacterium]|nr:DNA-deoxyinosine glycosylase [Candidatus Cloacimonadota bacterium]
MPVSGKDPRVLILGSFPSIISLEKKEYYGNKNNHFWKIMEKVAGIDVSLSYNAKIRTLTDEKIALWDVVSSCTRKGSSDNSLKDIIPNDIPLFLQKHRTVKVVILNGKTGAGRLFLKTHPDFSIKFSDVDVIILPSTSPANAVYKPEDKISQWSVIQKYLSG